MKDREKIRKNDSDAVSQGSPTGMSPETYNRTPMAKTLSGDPRALRLLCRDDVKEFWMGDDQTSGAASIAVALRWVVQFVLCLA